MDILGILKALLQALPIIDKLLSVFKKTPQQKVDDVVEDVRSEIDEFRRTGRRK